MNESILTIHFITDSGAKDTVVGKLWAKAEPWFRQAFQAEDISGIKQYRIIRTGREAQIPLSAKLLYVRPAVI